MKNSENMTSLKNGEHVKKTDARIALRGMLDVLQSTTNYIQAEAYSENNIELAEKLEDVQRLLKVLMYAHVTNEPVANGLTLFGYKLNELRELAHKSYNSFNLPSPLYSYGKIPALINLLRAHVREAELTCANAIEACSDNDKDTHISILQALNRLSSGLYVLFAELISDALGSDPSSE